MRKSSARKITPDYLSVIHRSHFSIEKDVQKTEDLIIHTDLEFNITWVNETTRSLFIQSGNTATNLLEVGDIEILNGKIDEARAELMLTGLWAGQVLYKRFDGQLLHYKVTISLVRDFASNPFALVIVCNNLDEVKTKESELEAAEKKFNGLLNTLSSGVLIIGPDGKIITCNKKGAEIIGLTDEELPGKAILGNTWKAININGSVFPPEKFPAIVSLQTGFPQRNVVMGIEKPGGNLVWISVNSEALIHPGEFEPYAVVVSFTDITNFISAENELVMSNERFQFVSKVTTDAIWDFNLVTNEIYRSDAFARISGYSKNEISNNLNWWFDKIHPDDQARVKSKLENDLRMGKERWQDEYRFIYADGSYKVLIDSAIILYKNGKAVRLIGAIRDVTEEKQLKQQLVEEKEQKQKAITRATLNVQEQEKNRISRELHDNVNQIIMSAKLYMETARQSPGNADKLLDKAIEYQLLALHEIRKISKSLNTSAIKAAGLRKNIADIVHNLEVLQNITVKLETDNEVEKQLSEMAKLNVYRIIQEQTNNIIKYASATEVVIQLKVNNNMAELIVADNGKGFEPEKLDGIAGIGLINMNSRAQALDGTFTIKSAPGQGCSIAIHFPI
jgi:PAS domain S-box-containing protein